MSSGRLVEQYSYNVFGSPTIWLSFFSPQSVRLYNFFGSSSNSITRLINRPAPPQSRLR
jgi:hypothetical protein